MLKLPLLLLVWVVPVPMFRQSEVLMFRGVLTLPLRLLLKLLLTLVVSVTPTSDMMLLLLKASATSAASTVMWPGLLNGPTSNGLDAAIEV
jgi:hypothetical protein